ncbi:hypothetical protein FXF51_22005 [Nonomuraea sp. PA05]|uniref:hypothetical protein n=1 Tax=Nonomuraea sp. PA05 TaxID=2604466 RepID=UPI0011D9B7F4|nr:hypothetical protein [Nonomuraea sp. PA05]TYB64389.1 hypothetical protein FXF51_22005 [Nonomuraea sp. PA05]
MAGSGAERKTLTIWSGPPPTGQTEPHPKDTIRQLLGTAQHEQIMKAASAYDMLANALVTATVGIMTHAGKILTIWKGPDADKARVALELLYATGRELALKCADTGWCLQRYAEYTATAIAEVDGIQVDRNHERVQALIRFNEKFSRGLSLAGDEVTLVENAMAQEALKRLNEKIQNLQITSLPSSVTYELPTVTNPSASSASITVVYQSRSGTEASTAGHSSTGRDGGNAAQTGDADGRSENPADGERDEERPAADTGSPPASRPEAQPAPGEDRSGAQEQPDGGGDPAAQEQPVGQDADRDRDPEADTRDEPTAPVIGAEDRTGLDDVPADIDPTRTEASAYHPPAAVAPATIGELPVSTAPPAAPSVIGPSTGSYTPAAALAPMRGGSGTGVSNMPYMPMMPAGGVMGNDVGGDLERTTFVPEDKSSWNGGSHDVTDAVIG